jgi:hypothetical protein
MAKPGRRRRLRVSVLSWEGKKFLWGTGLTPKHLGLVYGPLCPLTIDSSLLHLQRRLAPSGARASISEGGN